ncbi:MAG: hydrolase [Nitrospirae bacterium]|nr:MAG: hydrolase [Nitrospirota bacterium]
MEKFFLDRSDIVLLIIDVQEKLARVMDERQRVTENTLHLIELAKLTDIPILITEQYPKGLGQTVSAIRDAIEGVATLEKITFSCCGDERFIQSLKDTGRRKVVVAGMETHVCVLQTALDLLKSGFSVHIVSDAVTSRKVDDKVTALQFLRDAGAVITCTETVLFQVLERAGTEEFKAISKRIK